MTPIHGRHALVTGANRGIGAAITRALSSEGASVSLLVRDAARATEVADSLSTPNAIVIADLTDRAAVHSACREAVDKLGPVDILVNNGGSTESAAFLNSTPELFARMFDVHLMGAVHTCHAILPSMVERGVGQVVNVASTAGLRGEAYVSAYVAAKHALVGLTRALALEMKRNGVRVNAVCPGYTATDLVDSAVTRVAQKTGRSPDDALAAILASAGQSRLVTPDEVAAAVIALCTGDITGHMVTVDGSET
jgi:NAD(P)-dependent dehydrogenase (short-subunit alcohol dehydrogenase family)